LAQLLRRPEIVIEDLAPVVREEYPEYFAEVDRLSNDVSSEKSSQPQSVSFRPRACRGGGIGSANFNAINVASGQCSGADPSPSPKTSNAEDTLVSSAPVRDNISVMEKSSLHTGVFTLSAAARNEMKTVETEIKYAGYLDQQKKSIERLKKAEQRVIPDWFDYTKVSGLSREMNEKLQRVRPRTLGQASRIPGVTPAAVSLINVYIEIQGRRSSAPAHSGA
jgi:hypothetical protein